MCGVRPFRRTLLLVGLVGFAITQTGCMSYTQIEPADVADYGEIRITTTTNGREETLWEPRIQADTLIGLRGSGDTLRIPLDRLETVEAGGTDAGKTAGLMLGLVGVAALSMAVMWFMYSAGLFGE